MGNNLSKIRKENKMTQQDLATILGVSRQYISDIERNKLIPSLFMAFKISNLFKLSVNDVFYLV